jgi:hypothetical protein
MLGENGFRLSFQRQELLGESICLERMMVSTS